MPNWAENEITLVGRACDISAIKARLRQPQPPLSNDEEDAPCPDWLNEASFGKPKKGPLEAGSRRVGEIMHFAAFVPEPDFSKGEGEVLPDFLVRFEEGPEVSARLKKEGLWDKGIKTKEQAIEWLKKTDPTGVALALIGAERPSQKKMKRDAWYNWRVANWGTKWSPGGDNTRWENDELDFSQKPAMETVFASTAWSPPLAFLRTLSKEFPKTVIVLSSEEEGGEFAFAQRIIGGNPQEEEEFNPTRYPNEDDPENDLKEAARSECFARGQEMAKEDFAALKKKAPPKIKESEEEKNKGMDQLRRGMAWPKKKPSAKERSHWEKGPWGLWDGLCDGPSAKLNWANRLSAWKNALGENAKDSLDQAKVSNGQSAAWMIGRWGMRELAHWLISEDALSEKSWREMMRGAAQSNAPETCKSLWIAGKEKNFDSGIEKKEWLFFMARGGRFEALSALLPELGKDVGMKKLEACLAELSENGHSIDIRRDWNESKKAFLGVLRGAIAGEEAQEMKKVLAVPKGKMKKPRV